MSDPTQSGWTSSVGPLPRTILPTDPVLSGWLDMVETRLQCVHVELDAIRAALLALPDELLVLVRSELGVAVGRAYLEGRREACSLCRGVGCESPSCRESA